MLQVRVNALRLGLKFTSAAAVQVHWQPYLTSEDFPSKYCHN